VSSSILLPFKIQHIKLSRHPSYGRVFSLCFAGLPDFSWHTRYTKPGKRYQIPTKFPNGHNIFQMTTKYTDILLSKPLQNLPKLWFWVWKHTIWQPCCFVSCKKVKVSSGNWKGSSEILGFVFKKLEMKYNPSTFAWANRMLYLGTWALATIVFMYVCKSFYWYGRRTFRTSNIIFAPNSTYVHNLWLWSPT
jgi:hypothetical protein